MRSLWRAAPFALQCLQPKESQVATTTAASKGIPNFRLYGEPARKEIERTLIVARLESRGPSYNWKVDPHVHHALHQMLFVVRGRGVARMDNHHKDFRPPALIVVPANTVHSFVFEPGTQGFVLSMTDDITRDYARIEPAVRHIFESPATVELAGDAVRSTDLKQSFAMIAREFERLPQAQTLALEGLLQVVLASALRLYCPLAEASDNATARQHQLVAHYRDLIEDNFRNGRSVAEYADDLNVSESRLRNACLSATDQSPMQILHTRVLLEAKRELAYTSASISEIAYGLGFDDPAYFTRFFTRRSGVSPRTFRARFPRV